MIREVIVTQTLNEFGVTIDSKITPLVRCKGCRFNRGDHKCLNTHSIMDVPADDDFCSYGEPKDDEEEHGSAD